MEIGAEALVGGFGAVGGTAGADDFAVVVFGGVGGFVADVATRMEDERERGVGRLAFGGMVSGGAGKCGFPRKLVGCGKYVFVVGRHDGAAFLVVSQEIRRYSGEMPRVLAEIAATRET